MQIQISGLFQVIQSGNTKFTDDLAVTYTPTSSNAMDVPTTILTGSWQALNTSSLANIRWMNFDNFALPGNGTVQVANSGSNGLNVIATLGGGDIAIIPWSASAQLYAQAVS